MRRTLALVAMSLGLLVAAGGVALADPGTPPTDETMVLVQDASTFATLGWSATGTFTDSGSWTVDRIVFGSDKTALFGDVEDTHVGANGTFKLSFHGGTTPVGSVAASWRMYGGTGAYTGVVGVGTWTQAFDQANNRLIFTLTGHVHS
jgi:hypothetical protein